MNITKVKIKNSVREISPLMVGEGYKTAIAVNLGLSNAFPGKKGIDLEIDKAKAAIDVGADMLLDVSISGDLGKMRKSFLELEVPIGTVPIYETCISSLRKSGAIVNFTEKNIIQTILEQAQDGIDIMTLHAAFKSELLRARANLEGLEVYLRHFRG